MTIAEKSSLLFGWRTVEASAALAGDGYDMDVCPGQIYYLDMANSQAWSEPMTDRGVFDRLVFPRLSALAETGWTLPKRKSFERSEALVGLMPILYGVYSEQ